MRFLRGLAVLAFLMSGASTPAQRCQIPDFIADTYQMQSSDLSYPPHGVAVADDFLPSDDSIRSVSVWGTYQDPDAPYANRTDCSGVVADKFRVRIYADFDNVPGQSSQPGVMIGERTVFGAAVAKSYVPQTSLEGRFLPNYYVKVFSFALDLGAPIVLPDVDNKVYWLEVANNTTHLAGDDVEDPIAATENTCNWFWVQTFHVDGVGNDFSHTGTDDRPLDQGGGSGYLGDGRSARSTDMAFCLGSVADPVSFTAPPTPLGACCTCDDLCQTDRTLRDCNDGIGDGDDSLDGIWLRSNDCDSCMAQGFDNCSGAPAFGGWYPNPEGLNRYNSVCLTTDGPNGGWISTGNYLVEETWFAYTATCTGYLYISGCASGNRFGGFDSYLAVHATDTSACPPCPTSNGTLMADENESCSGLPMGGAGVAGPFLTTPGDCFLIRAGGWADSSAGSDKSHGAALIDIDCIPGCTSSSAPIHGKIVGGGAAGQNKRMVRHLAVRADIADAGKSQAMRVKIISLPVPHNIHNGRRLFVGPPRRICEGAGTSNPPAPGSPPNFGCLGAGAFPRHFMAASLRPDPYYQDWHGVCTGGVCVGGLRDGLACTTTASCAADLNIYHTLIVPNGSFDVQLIDENCSTAVQASYSEPLSMNTSAYGDTVSDCSTMPCGPPNGSTEIIDVVAILNKFGNVGGTDKVRADIKGCCVDHIVQIDDVTDALDAFTGDPYPCPPGDPAASCP